MNVYVVEKISESGPSVEAVYRFAKHIAWDYGISYRAINYALKNIGDRYLPRNKHGNLIITRLEVTFSQNPLLKI